KRVHPHGLRHAHAAELSREGTSVRLIQTQLGHASVAVTDRYLRSIAPEEAIAAIRPREWGAPRARPRVPSGRIPRRPPPAGGAGIESPPRPGHAPAGSRPAPTTRPRAARGLVSGAARRPRRPW